MSGARQTHPRLYKLLDELKVKRSEDYAGRIDLYVHIILGTRQVVKMVHCEVCGPEAAHIGNAVIEKAAMLMSHENIEELDFTACFEAAKLDLAEFEASEEAAAAEAKDVLSRVSTDTKH